MIACLCVCFQQVVSAPAPLSPADSGTPSRRLTDRPRVLGVPEREYYPSVRVLGVTQRERVLKEAPACTSTVSTRSRAVPAAEAERDEALLRAFDLTTKFGPCSSM